MNFDLAALTSIKDIYISSKDFYRPNSQSCDCQYLVFDTSSAFVSATFAKAGEDVRIEFHTVTEFDKNEYKYKVLMHDEVYKYEDAVYCKDGSVEAIKLSFNNFFIFVFADEYNLILTKSKCDLFDEYGTIYEEEAKLEIWYNA